MVAADGLVSVQELKPTMGNRDLLLQHRIEIYADRSCTNDLTCLQCRLSIATNKKAIMTGKTFSRRQEMPPFTFMSCWTAKICVYGALGR